MFKIPTSLLRKNNWNLELDQAEAARNGWVVSLAESSMIRWIDDINGVDSVTLYDDVREIRRKIRRIKREDASQENAVKLKKLYNRLNDLLFIEEYLLIIVKSDKDYLRACKGFVLNGREYKRLVSTSNGVKMNVIVFASTTGDDGVVMLDELKRRMENGRDMSKAFVPAKLEAYRSLACSASLPVSDPRGVLVVPDVMTHFMADYISLSDNPDGSGEPIYKEVYSGECTNDASDGYGIISPELMEIWSAELGLAETTSAVCVRAPFTKGMLFTMDFVEFAQKIAHNYFVKDFWGQERNILDVDIILTESMLKLAGSYNSWEEYWENTKQNHSGFSVTKTAEPRQRESRELNYQFINPLDLSDEDIDELIAPTMEDLSGVCGEDVDKMIIYLCGEGMTESSVRAMNNDWIKALLINESVKNDPYVRQKIQQLLRKRFIRAKLGRLRTRGDFQIIGCDPYILLEAVFGLEQVGLLRSGEIYSKYWIDRNVEEVVLMRAPMTILNNLCKRKVSYSEQAQYWYRYLPNILLLNAWDLTAACANGADYDGDIMLTTDNPVFINHVPDQLAIRCEQKTAVKKIVTEDDVIQSNILSFGDDIGTITNRATALFDVRSYFEKDSAEYREASKRLSYFQHFQQNSIDRPKGVMSTPMPTYFYREHDAAQRGEFDRKLCISKKPWFMTFRYKDIAGKFNTYKVDVNKCCRVQFGCYVDDLLAKDNLSDAETEFLQWYHKNSPVSLGNCTCNRIARKIDAQIACIKNEWKQAGSGFSYSIYRSSDKKYKVEDFVEILQILDRYDEALKKLPGFAKANKMNDAQIAEYESQLIEEAKADCYCNCSSAKELASIVLDLTYGRGHRYQIAWDLCGDMIIQNLLRLSNGQVAYYERAKDGTVEYKGERFNKVVMDLKEEECDDCY